MYVKVFASLFEGSFYGAGPVRYAVWVYLLAKSNPDGIVSCNARACAAAIGCSEKDVTEALEWLASPDSESRNEEHEGRRIERVSPYEFFILNYEHYRKLKTREMERDGARVRKQRERERKSQKSQMSRMSRQEEKDEKREIEGTTDSSPIGSALVPVKAKSWNADAAALWNDAAGGAYPPARMGKELKPLVEQVRQKHGLASDADAWDRIRESFIAFAGGPKAQYGVKYFVTNPKAALGMNESTLLKVAREFANGK